MLAKEITTALRQGKHTFISGMARGSDIYAAELVLEYRAQYPDIHLICALPHPDFEKFRMAAALSKDSYGCRLC